MCNKIDNIVSIVNDSIGLQVLQNKLIALFDEVVVFTFKGKAY